MSSAPVCRAAVCRADACRATARRSDRPLLIKAGLLLCLGIFVLSGCGGEAAPVPQRVGSAQRTAPGQVSVATAMGRSVAAYPEMQRSAPSPQTDDRNQTDALVLFTSMRKARVLHGLH